MWALYHSVRTSTPYQNCWKTFLSESVRKEVVPAVYQTIADKLFSKRIEKYFPIIPSNCAAQGFDVLTYEEENAIHYAAGYVYRATRQKLIKSKLPDKMELCTALSGLLEDEDSEDVEEDAHYSTDWIKLADRGGLV